jgi:hypothetical protein
MDGHELVDEFVAEPHVTDRHTGAEENDTHTARAVTGTDAAQAAMPKKKNAAASKGTSAAPAPPPGWRARVATARSRPFRVCAWGGGPAAGADALPGAQAAAGAARGAHRWTVYLALSDRGS